MYGSVTGHGVDRDVKKVNVTHMLKKRYQVITSYNTYSPGLQNPQTQVTRVPKIFMLFS